MEGFSYCCCGISRDRTRWRVIPAFRSPQKNSQRRNVGNRLASIAFPAISTGAYGYPKEEAAAVSSQTIKDFLAHDTVITLVRLIFYSLRDAEIYLQHHRF